MCNLHFKRLDGEISVNFVSSCIRAICFAPTISWKHLTQIEKNWLQQRFCPHLRLLLKSCSQLRTLVLYVSWSDRLVHGILRYSKNFIFQFFRCLRSYCARVRCLLFRASDYIPVKNLPMSIRKLARSFLNVDIETTSRIATTYWLIERKKKENMVAAYNHLFRSSKQTSEGE